MNRLNHLICLWLPTEDERTAFNNFKLDNINKNLSYFMWLCAGFTVFLLIVAVISRDEYFLLMLLAFVIMSSMLFSICVLSKRWSNLGAYLMPMVFIYCFCGQAFWSWYGDVEFTEKEWDFVEYKTFVVQECSTYMNYVLFVYLFSPSMLFTTCVYVPIFAIGKILLDVQIHDCD